MSKRADQQAVGHTVRALIFGEARQRGPKKRERSERFSGRASEPTCINIRARTVAKRVN